MAGIAAKTTPFAWLHRKLVDRLIPILIWMSYVTLNFNCSSHPTSADKAKTRLFSKTSENQVPFLARISFDDYNPGEVYGFWDVQKDFGSIRSLGTGFPNSRVKVVAGPGSCGNAIQVRYPGGKIRSFDSGASWHWKNFGNHQDLYLGYWLRFSAGFQFKKGGKLPGLCGGDCNTGGARPNGHDGWSSRVHWGKHGSIKQYVYHKDQNSRYGDTFFWAKNQQTTFIQKQQVDIARTDTIKITDDRWHYIITRVVVNDIGQKNGLIQSWFDGDLVLNTQGFEFRDPSCSDADLLIDNMYFSTFFGGSDDLYRPDQDQYIYFDEFVLAKVFPYPPEHDCNESRILK